MKKQTQKTKPGKTHKMNPPPEDKMEKYVGTEKFRGKVVVITGGDSGIGRAMAIGFAKEGAKVAIMYLNEHRDARETKKYIEAVGSEALLIPGDIGSERFCKRAAEQIVRAYGRIDVLCNNAAEQHPQDSLLDITAAQLERTFRTNIFGMFYMTKAVLPHLKSGSAIVNTTSITAYQGSPMLLDYSSTKGAIVTFTRSLAKNLVDKGIRVNAVAPGPIWTPLIPSTFHGEKVAQFGSNMPMGRAGQPDEIAPAVIFLASDAASYISGQVIHINGGEVVNG